VLTLIMYSGISESKGGRVRLTSVNALDTSRFQRDVSPRTPGNTKTIRDVILKPSNGAKLTEAPRRRPGVILTSAGKNKVTITSRRLTLTSNGKPSIANKIQLEEKRPTISYRNEPRDTPRTTLTPAAKPRVQNALTSNAEVNRPARIASTSPAVRAKPRVLLSQNKNAANAVKQAVLKEKVVLRKKTEPEKSQVKLFPRRQDDKEEMESSGSASEPPPRRIRRPPSRSPVAAKKKSPTPIRFFRQGQPDGSPRQKRANVRRAGPVSIDDDDDNESEEESVRPTKRRKAPPRSPSPAVEKREIIAGGKKKRRVEKGLVAIDDSSSEEAPRPRQKKPALRRKTTPASISSDEGEEVPRARKKVAPKKKKKLVEKDSLSSASESEVRVRPMKKKRAVPRSSSVSSESVIRAANDAKLKRAERKRKREEGPKQKEKTKRAQDKEKKRAEKKLEKRLDKPETDKDATKAEGKKESKKEGKKEATKKEGKKAKDKDKSKKRDPSSDKESTSESSSESKSRKDGEKRKDKKRKKSKAPVKRLRTPKPGYLGVCVRFLAREGIRAFPKRSHLHEIADYFKKHWRLEGQYAFREKNMNVRLQTLADEIKTRENHILLRLEKEGK